MFDFFVATVLLTWAYATGRLPSLPDIPDRPAFEWSFIARHERGTMIAIGVLVIGVWLALRWLDHHVRAFWLRLEQGVVILRTPRRYLRNVVSYQAVGWGCRLASQYYMLQAFGVHATVRRAARARGRVDLDAAAGDAGRGRRAAGAARDRPRRPGLVVVADRVLGRRPGRRPRR